MQNTIKSIKRILNWVGKKHEIIQTTSSENPEVVPNSVFVIMPMNKDVYPEWKEAYKIIKSKCKDLGLNANYIEDLIVGTPKTDQLILDEIGKSEFLIIDLTASRPNVYFELGYLMENLHVINLF